MPEAVKLYATAPQNAEVLGLVSSTSNAGLTYQQAKDSALLDLKKRAAQIGANGIILTASEDDSWSGSKISGQAIFVP